MKKFLTVLLALSVVFTYSFSAVGTAFAASGTMDADTYAVANISKVYEEVAAAQEKVGTDIEKLEADALYAIFAGKASKDFGNLVVTSEQVKAYYDSEVVAKVKAQASNEASAIYAAIQAALNDKADYIRIVTNGDAGKWTNANGEVVYNINVVFSNTLDGTNAASFTDVFDKDNLDSGSKSKDIAKDAFAAAVTEKLAEIAAISEGSYIAKDQDAVKDAKAKASKQVTQLGSIVANGNVAFSDVNAAGSVADLDVVFTAATTVTGFGGMLKSIYTPAVNEAPATGALVNVLKTLTLSADEPTEAAKLTWARAQVMAKFEDAIGAEYDDAVAAANKTLLNESLKGSKADQSAIDAANKTIADAKELKAAALEIATYLVNDCDDYKKLITTNAAKFADNTPLFGAGAGNWNYDKATIASPLISVSSTVWYYTNLVKVVGYVKDVKEEAEALKAEIAIDGTTAVDVDALLEKAIDKIYKTGAPAHLPAYTSNQVLHTRQHALTGVDCFDNSLTATTVKVNSKTYTVVDKWDETAYEAARLDEVKAIKKETKAAVMAAATVADAEAAFLAGLEKYNAVLDKNDKAMNQAAKAFVDLKNKYVAQLKAELDYVVAGINAAKANNAPATTSYVNNLTADLAKAYTTDELTEKYNELSAEVKALKDKTTLDAEKKALEERCKAYSNKTITVEDKADLIALRKDVAAFRDYSTRLGAGYVVADYGLDNKLKAVADIEKKSIEDAYKVINKDGKATLDEAAAVAELRSAVDAYNDGWDALIADLETGAAFTKTTLTVPNLAKFEKDVFDAQVDNVESMIGKLPADGSDVAAVKAAREAYEALSLCQKNEVASKYYDKLVDCEKLIAKNVETLKITVSTKLYKGSKIRVKWTVKGNTSGIDGYQVYKSTKAQKGYKFMGKTTKTYMDNKKSLKKGTRYYYKVRAYKVVDGKTYYSDWSNKGNRIYK